MTKHKELLRELVAHARYGVDCNDHEIMNPENHAKETAFVEDAYEELLMVLLDREHRIEENERMREALEILVNDIEWRPNSPTLKMVKNALKGTR